MNAQLTPSILATLIGGQMEIQNRGEGYLYRGEIKAARIEGGELKVEFVWLAKHEDGGWKNDDRLTYDASLEIYSVSNLGPSGGEVGGSDRWSLSSALVGEMVVIFPPDGSKLDPAKVEGLVLTPA